MHNTNYGKSFSSEKALDATDAVISELKNLARSMLEATNLARNKTRAFGRPCVENYLCGLQEKKEENSEVSEREEVNCFQENESKIYQHKCNVMEHNLESNRHEQYASSVTLNNKLNEDRYNNVKDFYNDGSCLEKEKYIVKSNNSMNTNKTTTLSKDFTPRACRLPERKCKANVINITVNGISNHISIEDVIKANHINNNTTKTAELHESINSLYLDKFICSNNVINTKEIDNVATFTKDCNNFVSQEISSSNNCIKKKEDHRTEEGNLFWQKEICLEETKRNAKCNVTGISTYTDTPIDEHSMCEQAKMIKWFGSINDGVCTLTFEDLGQKMNEVNVHAERENVRVEWYNNILNSLWNAEPHTRFVDIKQNDIVKNSLEIIVNTKKQPELKESENKADENDINFCTNSSWCANWCEDDDVNCLSTRKKTQCIPTKVFRVPSFPFGGGITWAQLEYLQCKFNEVLQKEANKLETNKCTSYPINEEGCCDKTCIEQKCTREKMQKFPRLITLKAFSERLSNHVDKHVCDSVAATINTSIVVSKNDSCQSINNFNRNSYNSNNINNSDKLNFSILHDFNPASPYEFVTELERKVIFDAVLARRERLELFRREVEKKKYPAIPDTFDLRIIMDPLRTGFQEDKTFPIIKGDIIADRYQVIELLGKATFSRTVRCYDLHKPIYAEEDESLLDGTIRDDQNENYDASETSITEEPEKEQCQELESYEHSELIMKNVKASTVVETLKQISGGEENFTKAVHHVEDKRKERKMSQPVGFVEVCLKIINNSKDFFDQSLDEIRLLRFINAHKDADEVHVIRLFDAFYYKEHTMLVTELLSDNLYEYSKYNRENENEPYFTLEHLRTITRQITESLAYIHSLKLIHADLKPENILFVSHRRCTVKIIDFGSSCFLSDHLSSYIQSRSYRAPEVILGCDYDGRIDVWSLGAILVELVTGEVLFPSKTVPDMLARIVHVCGSPLPRSMLWEGRHTCSYFNKFGCIYEVVNNNKLLAQKEDEDIVFDGTKFGQVENNDDTTNGKGRESTKRPTIYLYTPVHEIDKKYETEEKLQHEDCRDILQSGKKEHNGEDYATDTMSSLMTNTSYSVLRQKLAAAGMNDTLFISFVETCLNLDHKERLTSNELLTHPFISQQHELERKHIGSSPFFKP